MTIQLSKEELIQKRINLEKFASEYLDLCRKYNIHIVADCRDIFVCTDAIGPWENKLYESWFKTAIKDDLKEFDERIKEK